MTKCKCQYLGSYTPHSCRASHGKANSPPPPPRCTSKCTSRNKMYHYYYEFDFNYHSNILATTSTFPLHALVFPSGNALSSYYSLYQTSARSEEHTSELQSHLNLVC